MSVALTLLAMLIEAVVGYPDRLVRAIGHPVIWIGTLISGLERWLNRNGEEGDTGGSLPAEGARPGSIASREGDLGAQSEPGGGCEIASDASVPIPPPQGGEGVSSASSGHFSGLLIELLSGAVARLPGVLALISLITVVGAVAVAVQWALAPVPFGFVALALIASSLIAQRSLHEHVARVASALETGGLETGRDAVSRIVGRDPKSLDAAGVARAAIESLAENFSDGVVAPVLWLAAGGLPGAAIYKAVNTADSMIGHRTPRYECFGWAAARLDDLLNLPASRLAALLLIAAAAMTSRKSAARAWSAVRHDAPLHRSPNAGFPEAAMAGALSLKLAGPRVYSGRRVEDAFMGDGRREATAADIRAALALYRRADAMLIALLAGAAAAITVLA